MQNLQKINVEQTREKTVALTRRTHVRCLVALCSGAAACFWKWLCKCGVNVVCACLRHFAVHDQLRLVKLFCSAAMSISHQSSADESLWQAINADIGALQQIVSSHFQTDCQGYTHV